MKTRKANDEDTKQLAQILMQVQELHYKARPDVFKKITEKEAEKEIIQYKENKEKEIHIVEDENNKICGFVVCKIKIVKDSIILKDANILYIEKIVVDKKERRKGVGGLLIKEISRIAKKLECSRIELNCWNFNKEAIEFYKSQSIQIQKLDMELKM